MRADPMTNLTCRLSERIRCSIDVNLNWCHDFHATLRCLDLMSRFLCFIAWGPPGWNHGCQQGLKGLGPFLSSVRQRQLQTLPGSWAKHLELSSIQDSTVAGPGGLGSDRNLGLCQSDV